MDYSIMGLFDLVALDILDAKDDGPTPVDFDGP